MTDTFEEVRSHHVGARSERGDASLIWNVATVVVVVVMLCVAGVFLTIFINPEVGINPFPPPTLPVVPTAPPLPTATNTPRILILPSWTPTPDGGMMPGSTPEPPDLGAQPTATLPATPLPGNYSFVLQAGSPSYIPSLGFHPDAGCNWMGVAGQAVDLRGAPVIGLFVELGGFLEGITYQTKLSMTGVATQFGQGGFEFTIADRPIASNDGLWIRLLDQQNLPLSEKILFDTYTDCDKNLVIIYFQQVR